MSILYLFSVLDIFGGLYAQKRKISFFDDVGGKNPIGFRQIMLLSLCCCSVNACDGSRACITNTHN